MATLSAVETDQLEVIEHAYTVGCGVLVKKPLDNGRTAQDDAARLRALNYIANVPAVSSVVIGTTNPAHLLANAAAFV